MSVICQNFVQNAWKKDLCSNCFKSVGDHDMNESIIKNEIPVPNQSESIRYASQAANVFPTHTNSTPHTTWKTLISEKNSKNTQPFKLENGFQGRLLTINKASHGIEKKFIKNTNSVRNGRLSKSCSNDDLLSTTNGHSMTINTDSIARTYDPPINGYSLTNGNGSIRNEDLKVCHNTMKMRLNERKNECNSIFQKDHPVNGEISNAKKYFHEQDDKRLQPKLVKSKSEDSLSSPLHSILKKTISSPTNSSLRRSGNVGFKDEEPLVIGYGGRDFSPEELEWDMNISDMDNETASDSLDETEDDKAFSKMTKQNTEFNSDNANLLQKNLIDSDSNEMRSQKSAKKTEDLKKTPANLSQATLIKNNEETYSLDNSVNGLKSTKDSTEKERGVTAHATAVENDGREFSNKMADKEKDRNKGEFNSRNNPIQREIKDSGISNQTIAAVIKEKNDSLNVTIKSDKASYVVSSGEVTVVEAEKTEESRVQVKNSPELVNEALLSSRVISPQNSDDTVNEAQDNSEMFSDGEEQVRKDASTLPDENNEWQNGSGLAGQILQAINTSLTNRHKMKEEQTLESCNADQSSEIIPAIENSEGAEKQSNISPPSDNNTVNKKNIKEDKIESSDEETIENELPVEPRKSFLHGVSSNKQTKTKPSAIYGPASDLFITRSDSSSSSSSDELSKSDASSHSINVIVNGETNVHQKNESITETENETDEMQHNYASDHESNSINNFKTKPKIPAKPSNPIARSQPKQCIPDYTKTKPINSNLNSERKVSISSDSQNDYYSVGNVSTYSDGPKSVSLIDHYAESNIYHEVDNTEVKLVESDSNEKAVPRESKLAALAMELEQVRHCNGNTKRQAPAPPKIPDPPLEDPPNCTGRTSPLTTDTPHGFASFRGEAMAFSSSSSTTSTSSQDTETGYASWNIHGDMDDQRKQSKSKSSFLLTQYSKCKMLAMSYSEENSKNKKRFSLKKLLKIRKESEAPAAFDPNCPNPKAWKYSDHFERPRAKLEIIHPMDLENKSVTVNPGFESLHSGSMSSFTANADDISLRNSVSSDYGSFYSDTMTPIQDLKSEVNYECIPHQHAISLESQEDSNVHNITCNSNSPTPSRISSVSQASTLTSGSSKHEGPSPHRPPKPPPPPRAHSLLPGNKALNADGTFKFPVLNCHTTTNGESPIVQTKPQAPKRQAKSTPPRMEYGIYDNTTVDTTPAEVEILSEDKSLNSNRISVDENTYGTILDVRVNTSEKYSSRTEENEALSRFSQVVNQKESTNKNQVNIQASKPEYQAINVTVKTNVSEPIEKVTKNAITRNRNSPVTKAPARPPPIYMKTQINNIIKNPNPWKTLEDSYLVLTSSNRELLVKLVNQALKRRKNYLAKLAKLQFQWSDFEIDVAQPSSIFAFGEKIAYHATIPKYPEYSITLVVTVQQQQSRVNENNDLKYPVFGQFVDYIPKELLDNSNDVELESMQATILVLDRSNISTIECFTESLPSSLTEENEKELCFIILQLIHSLKSLQAHGIESIDSSFQNLILSKSKQDKYNTLVFLSDNCYDENDYLSDSCKVSLCQYTLMLLFQLLGIQSAEEFFLPPAGKFSSDNSKKVFETAVSLLSEEKAVSLSQTKTLFECFLWEVTKLKEKLEDSDDVDAILHRWLDIKRANYIKSMIDDEKVCDINMISEYYSQFLIRTSVRNIKEIISYL